MVCHLIYILVDIRSLNKVLHCHKLSKWDFVEVKDVVSFLILVVNFFPLCKNVHKIRFLKRYFSSFYDVYLTFFFISYKLVFLIRVVWFLNKNTEGCISYGDNKRKRIILYWNKFIIICIGLDAKGQAS